MSLSKKIVADNMILTKNAPTTAGSKMLEGYMSLFDAEALTRLTESGYTLEEKTAVGEFAIDLIGETAYDGGEKLRSTAEAVADDEVCAAVCLDVNGAVRRVAAQNNFVSVKPTYGTVSRYGTIPVACSGETVSVMAKTTAECKTVLDEILGHDDKDGTSLPEEQCVSAKGEVTENTAKKVALFTSDMKQVDAEVSDRITKLTDVLKAKGVEVCEIKDEIIEKSKIAWNILMSAELCNNVSRYDGVKYGYRAKDFSGIDEMYTNTRTEAFGELLKTAIIFGSETLSTDNYFKVYDKALRMRRLISERFAELFKEYDAVIMPACSKYQYDAELTDKNAPFDENFYTAPASIVGLPAVVAGGVQLVGKAFSEKVLFGIAKIFEEEGAQR